MPLAFATGWVIRVPRMGFHVRSTPVLPYNNRILYDEGVRASRANTYSSQAINLPSSSQAPKWRISSQQALRDNAAANSYVDFPGVGSQNVRSTNRSVFLDSASSNNSLVYPGLSARADDACSNNAAANSYVDFPGAVSQNVRSTNRTFFRILLRVITV